MQVVGSHGLEEIINMATATRIRIGDQPDIRSSLKKKTHFKNKKLKKQLCLWGHKQKKEKWGL